MKQDRRFRGGGSGVPRETLCPLRGPGSSGCLCGSFLSPPSLPQRAPTCFFHDPDCLVCGRSESGPQDPAASHHLSLHFPGFWFRPRLPGQTQTLSASHHEIPGNVQRSTRWGQERGLSHLRSPSPGCDTRLDAAAAVACEESPSWPQCEVNGNAKR